MPVACAALTDGATDFFGGALAVDDREPEPGRCMRRDAV